MELIPGNDIKVLAATTIYFPLITAFILLFFGKRLEAGRLGKRVKGWTGWLATFAIARSFAGAVVLFFELISRPEHERAIAVKVFDWIKVGGFDVSFDLLVDPLSVVMLLVVTGVGTLIHIYSTGYMHDDERYSRFFAYMNLFVASMLVLVLANNVLLLYVGWEGVGLCSYLLIGFWFEKPAAANAAKKAFIVNRIGDFAFLLGIFLLSSTVGSLAMGQINAQAGAMGAATATTISLLLFAGATGKSAQIPLYVWLPDAMEGPTPVSALIHAATMVTAGVYMVARLSPVFEAGDALVVVGWIGALTALWGAFMAATEYDIKRVLAYSTMSQLGYMFLAHGVHAYSAGIFHLVTHAFFKALMFLGAGAVMHALAGETDMRKMGGLRKVMPITGWTFMAGWLAICGVIPFAGFFSKDAILASAWHEHQYALWSIGVLTAALTAFYMSRLYLRVFEGKLKVPEGVHAHDAPWTMAAALVPLAVLAVVGGVINLPGTLTLEHFLEPVVGASHVPEGITPWILAGAALAVAAVGILLARALYMTRSSNVRRRELYQRTRPLVDAARNKFYVDEFYGRVIVMPGKRLAQFAATVVDAKIIDGFLTGIGRATAGFSEGFRRVQTGYVRSYALVFLFGAVAILSILVLRVS
ncbi:MAG: NADH-quinone oxidoreductase subunit [Actinomycetota bacterium]|jgi:NADH-quinone oxidoreductase subunit L|nr:NADH-quinone oxidoreductase subunit [Actinomycetota bacterium]